MARFASSLQKKYLEDYAVQHGFDNIQHFSDDGYSGTNFNRPAFNSLLTEIEAGRVGTVIVKDMSRFGRNYLQVGFYTEMMFPKKNVRFIAVNNGVDSAKSGHIFDDHCSHSAGFNLCQQRIECRSVEVRS